MMERLSVCWTVPVLLCWVTWQVRVALCRAVVGWSVTLYVLFMVKVVEERNSSGWSAWWEKDGEEDCSIVQEITDRGNPPSAEQVKILSSPAIMLTLCLSVLTL